jgi:prepilin-type N-terminal cleavage/methylation domain-containing protein
MGGLQYLGQFVAVRRDLRRAAGAQAGGFTIIEVLIVLAVTGMLFVSAAIMISGRQSQAAFDQGIHQLQVQIQQSVNEVASGFFPGNANFTCNPGAAGPILSGGSTGQGSNDGCIFVGKALQFKPAPATDPEELYVYTLAGLKNNPSGQAVGSFGEAKPMVIGASSSHPAYPSLTAKSQLQNGITVTDMCYGSYPCVAAKRIGAVAFTNSFATYSGGAIVSGSQQVLAIPVPGTTLNSDPEVAAEAINADGGNKLVAGQALTPTSIYICFGSGGTNQSGLIKIGGSGRDLSVTLAVKSGNKLCN